MFPFRGAHVVFFLLLFMTRIDWVSEKKNEAKKAQSFMKIVFKVSLTCYPVYSSH